MSVKVGDIAPATKPDPPRDQWGRYVVVNEHGERESYRRCTSVAHKLGDSQGLEYWGKTMIASGMGQKPDLVKMAAAQPDPKLARSTYKEIVEAAEEASGANAARRRGTALHALTEALDLGRLESVTLTDDDVARLEAYQAALEREGLTIVTQHVEEVLLLDSLKIAGTADRFALTRYGRKVVADLKTGSLEYGQTEWAGQLAVYANHDARWEHLGGDDWERRPAIPDVDREWGVIIHLPATGPVECTVHWVDLEAGFGGMIYANGLMEYRRLKVMYPFNGGVVPGQMEAHLATVTPLPAAVEGIPVPEPASAPINGEATPEALYDWIADRLAVMGVMWEQGDTAALEMAIARWPSTVPKPLPEVLAMHQVEDMATMLDYVEREHQMPFPGSRPGTTVAEVKASMTPRTPAKKATPRPRKAAAKKSVSTTKKAK